MLISADTAHSVLSLLYCQGGWGSMFQPGLRCLSMIALEQPAEPFPAQNRSACPSLAASCSDALGTLCCFACLPCRGNQNDNRALRGREMPSGTTSSSGDAFCPACTASAAPWHRRRSTRVSEEEDRRCPSHRPIRFRGFSPGPVGRTPPPSSSYRR